jgi:predicted RecA/RadA family phage recombinase
MAANRKHNGHRIPIASASATIESGKPVVQEGWFGIALGDAASGAPFTIAIDGVWNIAVPSSTVKGEFLYVPGANGALTEDADVTSDLTRTPSNINSPVVKVITDRSSAGYADVLILPPGASKAATQV